MIRIQRLDKNQSNYDLVYTNFIYNRFDLFCNPDDFEIVSIVDGSSIKVIEFRIWDTKIELGVWLVPLSANEIQSLILYLHKHYPNHNSVIFQNALFRYGKTTKNNHFRIPLPDTVDELESRVSHRTKKRIIEWKQEAEKDFGLYKVLEFSIPDIPEKYVKIYFQYKKETHKRDYNLSPKEYIDRYHVTNCYVMMFGDTVGAIRFSCEQTDIVYSENSAYNPEMKDYVLGKVLRDYHLQRMVEKHYKEVFLGGGQYEHKKHYGGIEETVYDGNIDMGKEDFSFRKHVKILLKQLLPVKLTQTIRKIKKKLRKQHK